MNAREYTKSVKEFFEGGEEDPPGPKKPSWERNHQKNYREGHQKMGMTYARGRVITLL